MQKLFSIFEDMGYGDLYFRQGSLSNEDDYPASFFTYWNINSPQMSFYDNKARRYVELIQVCFYANNSDVVYSEMDKFVENAIAAGFVPQGMPHDTPSGKSSHSGRLIVIQNINNIGG